MNNEFDMYCRKAEIVYEARFQEMVTKVAARATIESQYPDMKFDIYHPSIQPDDSVTSTTWMIRTHEFFQDNMLLKAQEGDMI